MSPRVPVVEKITKANDQVAALNRDLLDRHHVFGINLLASPGAGKTSLIEATLPRVRGRLRVGVVEGDLATSLDAERAAAAGAPAVQITTGGACHLDATMVYDALPQLPLARLDVLIVENVGNLICPASFALGTHANVLVASTPEGDDKPYKYPSMYGRVDALLINKIDLLPHLSFDMERFRRGVETLNPGVVTFPVSCRTGEGLDAWIAWLEARARGQRAAG